MFGLWVALAAVVVAGSSAVLRKAPENPSRPALAAAAPAAPASTEVASQGGPALSPTPAVQRLSAGCGGRRDNQPGTSAVGTLQSGGRTRTYRVHRPAVGSSAAMPVVLNFHGRGSSGAAIEQDSGFIPVSDREGFLLVSPDGTGTPAGWGAGASMPSWQVDDVQFGRDLIASLEKDYCVDSARIYATGHSNGAFMAARLACSLPGRIAAIAPVAGVHVPAEGCAGPVPVLAFHGAADTVVPFRGGTVREVYRYAGVEQEVARWAAVNACTGNATSIELSPALALQEWHGCRATVELYVVANGTHAWPQLPQALGVANGPSTAQVIWDFFKGQSSPGG